MCIALGSELGMRLEQKRSRDSLMNSARPTGTNQCCRLLQTREQKHFVDLELTDRFVLTGERKHVCKRLPCLESCHNRECSFTSEIRSGNLQRQHFPKISEIWCMFWCMLRSEFRASPCNALRYIIAS